MKERSETEIFNKAAAYCAAAERCCSEVQSKLTSWEVPDDLRSKVTARLLKENYVDESRYCRSFVNDKFRFNKWGRIKIAQMLRYKGIAPEVIGEQLLQIDEAEYRETLSELLLAKRKSVRARNSFEEHGKLVRFALGRGFEMAEVRRALEQSGYAEVD